MRAPLDGDEEDALTPALGLLFAEIAELKRVRSGHTGGRSLAEVGFRRAWSRLLASGDAEVVAMGEVGWAAAHVALGPVDAAALADAGLGDGDTRAIYHRAAARWLGPLDAAAGPALDAVLDHTARRTEPFVERLCARPVSASPSARLAGQETEAERLWTVAVMAALIEHAGGRPLGQALVAALAAPADARTELAPRSGATGSVADAVAVADAVDGVLQQRHYANLAGFSLTDAVAPHEIVPAGPLRARQLAALSRLGLAF